MSLLPTGVSEGVIKQSSSLFGSLSPVVILILGLVTFFFVANVIIRIMEERRWRAYERETQLEKDLSVFGITKARAKELWVSYFKKDKGARKAVRLRANFEKVISGKDSISVNTV